MRNFRSFAVGMGMALALGSAAQAGVSNNLDLEGTWNGKVSCKGINSDGSKFKATFSGDIQIDQVGGRNIGFNLDGLDGPEIGLRRGAGPDTDMCGNVYGDASGKPKGQAIASFTDETMNSVRGGGYRASSRPLQRRQALRPQARRHIRYPQGHRRSGPRSRSGGELQVELQANFNQHRRFLVFGL